MRTPERNKPYPKAIAGIERTECAMISANFRGNTGWTIIPANSLWETRSKKVLTKQPFNSSFPL
jgi:hypothetical protein